MNPTTPLSARPAGRHAPALSLVLILALLAGSAPAQTVPSSPANVEFEAALLAYERNHWTQAFAALARLADSGHPEAARMALQMWRFGPQLYRTEFAASATQVERWTRSWGCGGDSTGRECNSAPASP